MAGDRPDGKLMPRYVSLKYRKRMADRFLHFRERYKLTQTELGKMIDLVKTEVIHIEKARRYPHYSTIARFNALVEHFKRGKELARAGKTGYF